MWLMDYLRSLLSALGLDSLARKNAKILFLGLDNAGKTTMMHVLKGLSVNDPRMKQFAPTQMPTNEEFAYGGLNITAFDLGGHEMARKVWKNYFPKCDGIVFLVDAFERARFEEAKIVLHNLLAMEEIEDVPIVVVGNKIDMARAASEEDVRHALGLSILTTGKDASAEVKGVRPMELFMCSLVRGFGLKEAIGWLDKHIK